MLVRGTRGLEQRQHTSQNVVVVVVSVVLINVHFFYHYNNVTLSHEISLKWQLSIRPGDRNSRCLVDLGDLVLLNSVL